MSPELTKAASDLCAWAQHEGVALFVLHTNEDFSVRYIGPQFPASVIGKMLRTIADGYEKQVPEVTKN